MSPSTSRPPTKQLDPDLARFCEDLAAVSEICAGATNAVLINANAVRLNVGIPRGGTVLLLRFPAAAVERGEPPLQDLLSACQPKPATAIHVAAERREDPATCTTATTGASAPAASGAGGEEQL